MHRDHCRAAVRITRGGCFITLQDRDQIKPRVQDVIKQLWNMTAEQRC